VDEDEEARYFESRMAESEKNIKEEGIELQSYK